MHDRKAPSAPQYAEADPPTPMARGFGLAGTALNIWVLATAMLVAAFGTSEVGSRVQALAQITHREAEELRAIVDVGDLSSEAKGMPDMQPPSAQTAPIPDVPSLRPTAAYLERRATSYERVSFVHRRITEARTLLETLSMRGGDVTVGRVMWALDAALRQVYDLSSVAGKDEPLRYYTREMKGPSQISAFVQLEPYGDLDDAVPNRFNFLDAIPYLLTHLRNDFLLALTVVSCALVGSIVTALRAGNTRLNPEGIALGLASGFIAFISLRGGRAVFMMEMAGETPAFNPYSMAFVGLLVGLFSTRAYALLTTLVDDLHGRMTAAFSRSAEEKAAVAATPAHGHADAVASDDKDEPTVTSAAVPPLG
jgi:hypothetical protein